MARHQSDESGSVRIEGLTAAQVLALPPDELADLVLTGRDVVLGVGGANVLGSFRRDGRRLILELGQVEGGGEGVLLLLRSLAHTLARRDGLESIEWIVHAVRCPEPNLKLRRVLSRAGFSIADLPGVGEVYHLVQPVEHG